MAKKWRYLAQQCLNFFVLINIDLIETPILKNAIANNLSEYDNILREQIYLQESGVSFSYTDTLSFNERRNLVRAYTEFIEEKNKKLDEIKKKI